MSTPKRAGDRKRQTSSTSLNIQVDNFRTEKTLGNQSEIESETRFVSWFRKWNIPWKASFPSFANSKETAAWLSCRCELHWNCIKIYTHSILYLRWISNSSKAQFGNKFKPKLTERHFTGQGLRYGRYPSICKGTNFLTLTSNKANVYLISCLFAFGSCHGPGLCPPHKGGILGRGAPVLISKARFNCVTNSNRKQ